MNKNIFTGIVLLILCSFIRIDGQNYNQQHRDDDRDRDKPAYSDFHDKRQSDFETRKTIKELKDRLNNLEMSLPPRLRATDRENLHRQIAEILNILDDLNPREEAKKLAPMSDWDFNDLFAAISKEPFSKGKQQIIFGSVDRNFFTIEQIVRVLSQFSFDDEKLTIVKAMYPKVLNQDRNYRLYDSFTFASSKDKLGDYLKNYSNMPNQH